MLAELWTAAEADCRLNPALVDCAMEQVSEEFGEFLNWCWRADRWPGRTHSETAMTKRPKHWHFPAYVWDWYEGDWTVYSSGVGLPLRCKSTRGKWEKHERFDTARAAFEFLYAAWQRLTDAERRQLWEAC